MLVWNKLSCLLDAYLIARGLVETNLQGSMLHAPEMVLVKRGDELWFVHHD